ncbi:carotenoid oxygenase family protein [Nodularia sphaerocarpa]|uniref:carotenoid oxygenase family protein n=3 Tax=Nodularia sphaerocarpa TaxID=137816 RepID=UPI001EFA409E|nr:carotenoid oxygenase family protein [Nodularia sphaerocarpa]MDB9376182.1 carotenoid oxygenase family protein [Nodularia sphaerocarpa CS-585]ULP74275.1 Carotenoid cleavage oxygenase [Nodularia sphaerocarpa UHCC 0038]
MTITAINPYLDSNFAPIQEEITTDTLKVIGELPPNLSGMFVRNGPNPQWSPIGQYHWFDGDGMLHGVRISNGQATYSNRYVRTRGWKIEQAAGKAVWSGLFEPPQKDNPHGGYKNTANTALVWHAGQMLALNEGGAPHAIKLPDLQTIGEYTYNNQLVSAFTAHPKVDPKTGEMRFFGYSFSPPYLQYSIVSAAGEIVQTVPIDLPMGVMMHDFAITENYTIFMDLPLTFSPERAQRGEPPMMFECDRPSRFGIIPRHGDNSNIRWFETSPCYVFHTLNAYEEQDEIVLIACRMSSTTVLKADDSQTDPDADIPRLHRWRFNLSTGKMREEMLDDVPAEFPRINENLLGQPTRYGYAGRMGKGSLPLFDGLIKYDLSNNKSQIHEFGQGRYGGEAVFAPSIGGTTEDDGWLVTFVYDESGETSELVVVNAQDITAEPVARVLIPQRVPYGFHGTWVSEEQLGSSV